MNFVTVQIRRFSSGFLGEIMLGGEKSREAAHANSRALLKQPDAQNNKRSVSTVCSSVSTRTINKGAIDKKSHNSSPTTASLFVGKLIKA